MAESGAPGADSAVNTAYSIPMVAEGENETLTRPAENSSQPERILTDDPGINLRTVPERVVGAVSSERRPQSIEQAASAASARREAGQASQAARDQAIFEIEGRVDSIEAQLFANERLRFKAEREIARYSTGVDATVKQLGELADGSGVPS